MNTTKLTYSEKLLNPRWQRLRLEILQRDDFMCQMCSDANSTLHVHHKKYIIGREPWEYEKENFVTYCHICHRIIEDIKEDITIVAVMKLGANVYAVATQTGKTLVIMYRYNKPSDTIKAVHIMRREQLEAINKMLSIFDR